VKVEDKVLAKPVDDGGPQKINLTSRCAFLCCPGTAIADGRIFLSSPNEPRPVLLVLQMKHSTADSTLTKPQVSTLYSQVKTHISPHYPGHRVLFGLVTNRVPSRPALSELQKHEDMFLISSDEISQFCPLLAHRLHPSFLPTLA